MNLLARLFRSEPPPPPRNRRVERDPAPHMHAAVVAIAALYQEAEARGDRQAMRYYAQAMRCLLGPTRRYLSSGEDLAPQPEW